MKLKNLMKEKPVLLIDLFDTLLLRKIQPEFVKKIWANHICKFFNLDINVIELYKYRSKIERGLYSTNITNSKECQITYKDILNHIYEYLKDNLNCTSNEFYQISKKIELDIECNVLYVDKELFSLIEENKKGDKKIICVIDTFYSLDMIESILEKLGINELFSNIYISSQYLKSQKLGSLYDIVLKKEKISADDCLLIGHNYYSNNEVTKDKRIESYYIDRSKLYDFYKEYEGKNSSAQVLKKFLMLESAKYDNFDKIIFSLYSFIEKLYYNLRKNHFKEVIFLSREGEFLKRLFDNYCDMVYAEQIKSHYIYVSRKSTYLPSLNNLEKENFSGLLDQYSYITINEFLNSLNFTEKEIKEIELEFLEEFLKNKINNIDLLKNNIQETLNVLLLDFNKKIGYFKDSKELKRLKSNSTFKKIYEKKRIEQKNLFKKYIKQVTKETKIMVVDIGWNGSIQDNIQNILGDKYEVYGSYFGLCLRNLIDKNKTGLVFSNFPYEDKQYPLYMENRTIYEILCGASHGSANKYVEKKGKVEVELFSKQEEKEIYNNIVKKSQKNMLKTFNELCLALSNGYYDNLLIAKKFHKIQFDIMYNPTNLQLQFFNKIYHYENFGVFGFTTFNNQNKIRIKLWIKEHIKFFVKYSTYFYDTFWPVLKLKNNKMYLPYFLYKLRRKKRYKDNNLF